MENKNQNLHEVVITGIIVKDDGSAGSPEPKYLITRRSNKKRFPGMWTVPGGKLEASDYLKLPRDTEHYWYNVLEQTLRREVKEEVGVEIDNIVYVTSLATVHADGSPSIVISCMADYVSGDIVLQPEESDQYAWVDLEEAQGYKLIDGIDDELAMAENMRLGKRTEWKRS